MTEVFLIGELVSEIIKEISFVFDENMYDNIPTYDEAVKLVTSAFAEGTKHYSTNKELLGELSETWVSKQRYTNISLDDAIYSAFLKGAILAQPFK